MLSVTNGRTFLRPLMSAPSSMTPGGFFSRQRRLYHEMRIGMFSRYPKTIFSEDDGVAAVDDMVAFAQKNELLVERNGCLTILTLPEFWANRSSASKQVYLDEHVQVEQYNAARPLPLSTFKAIVARLREHASKMPGGILIVLGGVAVDTEKKLPSGLTLGANYGVVVESGPVADCVLFNKVNHDPIDSWDESKFEPGTGDGHIGPLTRKVKDPSGGKARIWTAITCADMALGPLPEDMSTSDVVLAGNYGTPPHWDSIWVEGKHISEWATVAVNDSSQDDLNKASLTAVMEYRHAPKHPWLKGFHAVASWAGFGDFVLAAYQTTLGISPTEALAEELGFQKVATTVRKGDGFRLVLTGPRSFGPEPRQAEEVDTTQ